MSLTLEDVERLGGTKEEFEALGGVESGSEIEFGVDGKGEDIVLTEEIEAFVHGLGLGAVLDATATEPTAELVKKKKKSSHVVENGEHPESGKEEVERQLLNISAIPHTRLLVSPDAEQPWFDQSVSSEAAYPVSKATLAHLNSVALQLMRTETQLYEKVREKRKGVSDVRWLNSVLTSGTLSDKVAARTLLVQESPVHSLSSLDWLLGLVAKGGGSAMKGLHAKRKGILATNTLKELWMSELLPEHRKLKFLKQRPLDRLLPPSHVPRSSQRSLLLWYFEDQIKSRYLQFISTLQAATHDPAEEVREKMLGHVFDLLYQRPEQEQRLLTQLVNKLGDPRRKVASKTVMFLLKLLSHHVNMKVIVTREIESLLHRPNISAKAQYYGVCCLNQLVLGPDDGPLVAKLIDVYFTFFKVYIRQNNLDSKMLGGLLTGVNRAFPFMSEELPSFEDHLHSLFKVVHVGPISTGIQSLMLLYQVMESRQSVSSRYYNALYSKLLDPAVKHCNRQAMFLNVLFKSLKSDPSLSRVKLLKEKPALWPYILQGNDEEVYRDVPTNEAGGEAAGGVGSDGGEGVGEERVVQEGGGDRRVDVKTADSYKIWHRNPQFSGAEKSCLWELKELSKHYHPSVQLFSKTIASGEAVSYTSDPLEDFTTIKFLDRFVYKNPKLKESDHGGSAMQRTSRSGMAQRKQLMANSAEFAAMDESKVDVKEIFMHRFLTRRGKGTSRMKSRNTYSEEEKYYDGLEPYSNMDFAGELQREARKQAGRRKRRRGEDESSEEEEEEEEGEGGGEVGMGEREELSGEEADEFSYDDMDEEAWSDSEEEGGRGEGNFDVSKMFAAADEFSHLLEDGTSHNKGSHVKQVAWEDRQSDRHDSRNRMEGRGRGRRGRGGGGRGEGGRGRGREGRGRGGGGRGRGREGGGRRGESRDVERRGRRGGIRGSRRGRGGGGENGIKRRRVEEGGGGGRGWKSGGSGQGVSRGGKRQGRGGRGTRRGRGTTTRT